MQKYEVVNNIGKGSFGLVKLIKRKIDGKLLVWKQMNYSRMSSREKQQLVSEVNILRDLNHPNIVKYYDRIVERKETTVYIIMEYCSGGDVGILLKKSKKTKEYFTQDIIWKIFSQIIAALYECHNHKGGKILHRDLKPANIFIDAQNNIKLGDFGLSKIMSQDSQFAQTHVGTPYYMSPQQIQQAKYNQKSDIWSAGCLLYEMAALHPPFEATNHLSLAKKIQQGKYDSLPLRYSQDLQSLIDSMLNLDPQKRPSVNQLIQIPLINLRIKQKQLKDRYNQVKQKEEQLRRKEIELKRIEQDLNEKERNLSSIQLKKKKSEKPERSPFSANQLWSNKSSELSFKEKKSSNFLNNESN